MTTLEEQRAATVAEWLDWCARVRPDGDVLETVRAAWTHVGLESVDEWSALARRYIEDHGARLVDLLYALVVVEANWPVSPVPYAAGVLRNLLTSEMEHRARVAARLRDHDERLRTLEEHVSRLWALVLPDPETPT